MSNTSATGGYLVPASAGAEFNDAALTDFLQGVVVGVTGIPGDLVLPRWQPNPPNLPDANSTGITWASIGVIARTPDDYSYVRHTPAQGVSPVVPGYDTEYSNEIIEVLVSFYGPAAEQTAMQFARGLKIAQNREQMQLAGYALVNTDPLRNAPELVANQWLYRTDCGFRVRHQQQYVYPVLDLASAEAQVTPDGLPTSTVVIGE